MTQLLYGFADEEAEMELGMGGRLSKGCPPKVLWWARASLFHCFQDFPKQLCNVEITSENHICNSAENIYDPLTRGKKVEMEAPSLIEQRRLGTRRAQPGRPVRLTSPPPQGGYLLTLFSRLQVETWLEKGIRLVPGQQILVCTFMCHICLSSKKVDFPCLSAPFFLLDVRSAMSFW